MPDEMRDRLIAAAHPPGSPPDPGEVWRRGRRRRALTIASVVAVAVLAVGVTAVTLLPGLRPGPRIAFDTPTWPADEEVTGEPGRGQVCDAPPYRPTYLPWTDHGREAGEPVARSGGTAETPDAVLSWADDPEAFERDGASFEGLLVTLSTLAELDDDQFGPEFDPVDVAGHDGVLLWIGDPGIGAVSVVWREHPGACRAYAVGFDSTRALLVHLGPDAGVAGGEGDDVDEQMLALQRAIEAELVRVVEGLVRVPAPGGTADGAP
jgi:hypothetical protein